MDSNDSLQRALQNHFDHLEAQARELCRTARCLEQDRAIVCKAIKFLAGLDPENVDEDIAALRQSLGAMEYGWRDVPGQLTAVAQAITQGQSS